MGERLSGVERRRDETVFTEVRNYRYMRVLWELRDLGCSPGLASP